MSDDKRTYTVSISQELAEKISAELDQWNAFNDSENIPRFGISDWFNNAARHWLRSTFSTLEADRQYPTQVREFDAILADIAALHRRKAADYGAEPIADTGLDGVLIRMNDKLHRARRLARALGDGAAVNDETIEDTLQDLAAYAVIAVVLLRGKWGK